MSKLTTKQELEVIHKCADSIISEDGVVQLALHEVANSLYSKLEDMQNKIKELEDKLFNAENTEHCYKPMDGDK